ncbi:MAG TPA: 2Fe-2S iron-sulfur cluster-binding protein [Thermoleophilia bacterium]|nr:2Fe-2S iron-sulfur cluster-binding protein [Thermoleophilia bacterium]
MSGQNGNGHRRGCAPPVRRTGSADPVTCTINGLQVTVPGDVTILDAAQELGIHIPTLCYEPMLPPEMACRICMVEVEGADQMKPACATTVFDGMKVQTNTDRVRRLRKLYLELMLSDHDSFCTPPCQEGCPTHIKIPEYLDFIEHGDYPSAVRKLREDLPFPAILGRVCPRPCEEPCRRQGPSHGRGHTRPRMAGKGRSSRSLRTPFL